MPRILSRVSGLKQMISSRRFKIRTEGVVQQFLHLRQGLFTDGTVTFDAIEQYCDPRFEVKMMMVFLKSTVRPWNR